MKYKVCSFFGHRNTVLNDEQLKLLTNTIIDLIENKNVKCFLFGSRSNFDSICHKVVTELKEKCSEIIRKCYTCRSETCTLERERDYWEEVYSHFYKEKVTLLGVEEEVEHKTKYTSGKASYIERNQAMIDDSDYCIFFYDENYKPEVRKYSKRSIISYQPNSGTAVAFKYARQKKKEIINIAKLA